MHMSPELPMLLTSLNMHQEAYDVVKWFLKEGGLQEGLLEGLRLPSWPLGCPLGNPTKTNARAAFRPFVADMFHSSEIFCPTARQRVM